MEIGIPRETVSGESRVALVPDGVRRLAGAGHHIVVESGAGNGSFWNDESYAQAGAQLTPDAAALYAQAQLVLKVQCPTEQEIRRLRAGTALVGLLNPLSAPALMQRLAGAGISSFSVDALPRITRAQSMDVLSSMSTIAGYKAIIDGAALLPKIFPLLMTAAGTVTPARVLVLGAGVAGLQAIATARRLGAVVTAFDTRPVVREQVESLGATFLTLALSGESGEGAGGYARQMSEQSHAHERELLADPVKQADIIVSTAQVPGAPAPVLISAEMVAAMRPGSVILDLAAPSGGNCALTVPGERRVVGGVTVEGPLNLPATVPIHASQLFSRNMVAFVTHLLSNGLALDEATGRVTVAMDDEIVRSTCITHGRRIVHPATMERYASEIGELSSYGK